MRSSVRTKSEAQEAWAGAALANFASLPPNFLCRLVFPQSDVNRVEKQPVGRPGQIGDLGDQLRLDPMDAGEHEVT
jgi:hypothetical protein